MLGGVSHPSQAALSETPINGGNHPSAFAGTSEETGGCLYPISVCWRMLPLGHLALGPPGWTVEDTSPPPDLPAGPSTVSPRSFIPFPFAKGTGTSCEAENILNFGAKAGRGHASGWSFGSVVGQW